MAFERAPLFKFKTLTDTGFQDVPVGSLIFVEETAEILKKDVDDNSITTIKTAKDNGHVSVNITNKNIFDFLYYADEHEDRILGMDPESMTLAKEIHLTPHAHPGSCDRAAFSDKMYVRSATTVDEDGNNLPVGGRYLEVVDMVAAEKKRKIPLRWKPRSSGAYNRYRDMHAITTKENPWMYLVDCPTDKIVWGAGYDSDATAVGKNETKLGTPTYSSPQGNDGGNATGHAVWTDANHFVLLDRHNVQLEVFKIEGNHPPYTVTSVQKIATPTGAHSLRSFDGGLLLQDTMFCCAIEGAYNEDISDHSPEMWRMSWDTTTGKFDTTKTKVISFTDSYTSSDGSHDAADDNIHHFGTCTWKGRRLVAVPLTRSNRVYLIDVDDQGNGAWTLATDLMPTAGYYRIGGAYKDKYNTFKPGHCDLYTNEKTNMFKIILTNHGGNTVSIIDVLNQTITEVPIPELSNFTPDGSFTMSHANHIIGDYYFFFDAYLNTATGHKGTFHELHIPTNKITRSVVTGGKPVQSFS